MTSPQDKSSHLERLVVAGFLDSASGASRGRKPGDYAAIATVGRDGAGGLYALDIWIRRAAPTIQIQAIFDLHEKWNYALFGIETNCFQHLLLLPLEEERRRRRQAGRPWQLPVREVNHHQNKETRIATLEPLIANGWLRLNAALPDPFWRQLETFPGGAHDDALDALEGAVGLLNALPGPTRRSPARKSVGKLNHF